MQKVEDLDRPNGVRYLSDRHLVGQVAPHSHIGQKEVVFDHRNQNVDI